MKKRIISLLLAVITVMQIVPWAVLPIIAEDGISVEDMEVGKLYRAVWNYESYSDVYLYKIDSEDNTKMEQLYGTIEKESLPQDLTVKLNEEGDTFIYVTNEDWPAVYEGYRYVEDYELVILEKIEEEPEPDDGYIYGKVSIDCDEAVGNTVTLDAGEKLYAFTSLDAEISENVKYQWQIKLEDGRWATIGDYIYPYAVLSEALLVNAPEGVANIRCVAIDGNKKYASDELALRMKPADAGTEQLSSVTVDSYNAIAPVQKLSSEIELLAEGEEAFQIAINYVYARKNEDGNHENAYTPFIVSLSGNETFSSVVNSPFIIGYTACVLTDDTTNPAAIPFDGNGDGNDEYYLPQPSWQFENVGVNDTEKQKATIYYVPQKTNFIVEHYYQNLQDDGYSLAGMDVIKTRYTDEEVGEDLARDAYGFTPLFYDTKTTVSGNGNTVIEIYYDRIYYLVDFDLADGYGLMPYYVRYETQVMLTEPTRPGYSFANPWELTRVYTKENDDDKVGTDLDKNDAEISAAYANKNANTIITVKHNLDYKANWSVGDTAYTIVYWLENADSADSSNKDNYDVWYTVSMNSSTNSTTIAGGDHIKTYVTTLNGATSEAVADVVDLYPYLTYEAALTDTATKTVEGDGSTAINVYYSRKSYTLKFYYAMSSGNQWYVIGGSSNYFGASAQVSSTYRGDEIRLLDQYLNYTDPVSQVGAVSQPTLNTKGQERNYNMGSEQSIANSSYQHHYISFTAKYGADISELWPCDVFNSVTNQEKNTSNPKNGWSGTTAYVSAWNGEYNVKYTQDNKNGNQTVKGNYTQLDENLLWDSVYGESDTIAYACFWENGAEGVGWNVPKLFRYKIWLPVLDGQNTAGLTTKNYNGTTYYLSTSYDTCDDSSVDVQTQPALVGYTKNGSSSATLTKTTDYDGTVYKEGYEVNFYYSRITYTLSYDSQYGSKVTQSVPYGTSLNTDLYKDSDGPSYPSVLEADECVFGGWYIDEACQIPFDFNVTMPAKNILLYAKWITTEHNVKVYRQESEIGSTVTGELLLDKTVEFGTQVLESELAEYAKPNDNYVFGGWFYKDENGEESRYDFNTMVVKHSYKIYAKWTKNVPIPYTVKYVTVDSEGNKIEIAEADTGIALEGVKKTFTAKTGADLNVPYNEWYFPKERYITFEMSANAEDNVVEFVYNTTASLTYTISHVFKSEELKAYLNGNDTFTYNTDFTITKGKDAFEATIKEKFSDLVKETNIKNAVASAGVTSATNQTAVWNIIKGLTPDYYTQELHLVIDSSENVMTFTWEDAGSTTMYQVVHYVQNKDRSTYSIYSTEGYIVANAPGTNYSAEWMEIYGFTRNTGKSKVSGNLPAADSLDGLILELYYDREIYDYTVHHYVVGTTTVLSPDETKQAYFEQEILVSDLAKEIEGYVLYNGSTKHTIGSADYEITVFYSPMQVTFRYQEAIAGRGILSRVADYTGRVGIVPEDEAACTATAKDGYRFVGWFLDAGATQAVVSGTLATLSDDGATILPITPTPEMANQTITFYALFEPTTRVFKNVGVADADQAFVYHIKGNGTGNANVDVTFVITGNGQITLAMLPYGDYTITVESWAWRYELPNGQATNSWTVTINTTDPFVFDYSEDTPDNQWLTDDANGIVTAS